MIVDGLQMTDRNPEPMRYDVARCDGGPDEHWDGLDDDLGPVAVGRGERRGRRDLVVDVVDPVVGPARVQEAVDPVVEVVLHQGIRHQLYCYLTH